MKKIILLSIITAALVFVGCKKENQIVDNPPIYKTQGYYDRLSSETNVDILNFASSPELRQYLDETFSIAEELTEVFRGKIYTEEDMARMEELISLMVLALDNGDMELYNYYYNELCRLIGYRPWIAEEIATTLADGTLKFNKFIEKEYPSFLMLNADKQKEVIRALCEIIDNEDPDRADPCSRCWSTFRSEVRNAAIVAGIDMIGCALLGPFAGGCAAVVATAYVCSVTMSYMAYAACSKENGC